MSAHAPLRICFVTAEFASLAKSGGLADVAAALSRELHGAGHDVRVFLPGYAHLAGTALERTPVQGLQNLVLDLGPHRYSYSISTVHDPGSTMSVYLVECPALYHRDEIYTSAADEHRRFILGRVVEVEGHGKIAAEYNRNGRPTVEPLAFGSPSTKSPYIVSAFRPNLVAKWLGCRRLPVSSGR